MEPKLERVKSQRRYDSSGRRAQARRTRDAILDTAQRQFLTSGYAATTVAGVAREAAVSVETVYKAFGSKAGLVRALYARGLEGSGPVPAYQRSDELRESTTDPAELMRRWGELTAEVASEVTPVRLLMRAAAGTDAELAAVLAQSEAERLARMRSHARFLKKRGYLRAGVSVGEATDVLWTCSSVELYELLVLKRGWRPTRFARFVGDLLTSTLLPVGGDPSPSGS